MTGLSHLLLYIPVTLAVLSVIEVARTDDPKKVAKATARNFAILTTVLAAGAAVVFLINKFA
jgi:heme A synthase